MFPEESTPGPSMCFNIGVRLGSAAFQGEQTVQLGSVRWETVLGMGGGYTLDEKEQQCRGSGPGQDELGSLFAGRWLGTEARTAIGRELLLCVFDRKCTLTEISTCFVSYILGLL